MFTELQGVGLGSELSSLSLGLKFLNHNFQEKIYNSSKDVCLGARILEQEMTKKDMYTLRIIGAVGAKRNWFGKDLIFKIKSVYSSVGIT